MSDDKCLLVITVPPSLEDPLSDWLISQEQPVGFSSTSVNGHGEGHEGYTLAEQVRGSRRNIQFQIQTTQLRARQMLAGMERDFRRAELHYWIMPLLDGGRFRDGSAAGDTPATRPASKDAGREKAPQGGEANGQQQDKIPPDQQLNGGGTGTGDGDAPDEGAGKGAGGNRSH